MSTEGHPRQCRLVNIVNRAEPEGREAREKRMQLFKSVLAATDKINYRDEPVLAAARIARKNNAKLNVIHVLESSSTKNRDIVKHFQTGKEILNRLVSFKS